MKVTLAYPYTDEAGKNHRADTSLDLPDSEAIRLLESGRARTADVSTAKTGAPKEQK